MCGPEMTSARYGSLFRSCDHRRLPSAMQANANENQVRSGRAGLILSPMFRFAATLTLAAASALAAARAQARARAQAGERG